MAISVTLASSKGMKKETGRTDYLIIFFSLIFGYRDAVSNFDTHIQE